MSGDMVRRTQRQLEKPSRPWGESPQVKAVPITLSGKWSGSPEGGGSGRSTGDPGATQHQGREGPGPVDSPSWRRGREAMRKAPIGLQDLRRRIYRKAKSARTHRFWGVCLHTTPLV